MTQFKEQPKITFPSWAEALGFQDHSWHQDAVGVAFMPFRPLPEVTEGSEKGIKLYVAEDQPQDREYEELVRFYVCVCSLETDSEYGVTFYSGEDPVKAATVCRRLKELWEYGQSTDLSR